MSEFESLHADGAPPAAGPYSQAVRVGETVYFSGQIPCDQDGKLVDGDFRKQVAQLFFNLNQVVKMAGGKMNEIVKLTIYLTDFSHYDILNEEMAVAFTAPYPARMVVGATELPRKAMIAADAILYASQS
jgi:reactive intermediate/imine deaminase